MNSEFVYVVSENFDNDKSYEDHYWTDQVKAVVKTKAEAEEIVKKLYDEVISISSDEYGQPMAAKITYGDDGNICYVSLENLEGYSRSSGSYSYYIEEFELGKIKQIGS